MTFEEIRKNENINDYIEEADHYLGTLGYTEHGFAHIGLVTERTEMILSALDYDEKIIELAKIASYLHDIGNIVNRKGHSQSGALMAFRILDNLGFSATDISAIICAIGNHDEGDGLPVSPLAAALILADKSDVRRSRVRNTNINDFDIHDRVNYSVTNTDLLINKEEKTVELRMMLDQSISSVMDYFSVFMQRMELCQKAAEFLGLRFKLIVNAQQLF